MKLEAPSLESLLTNWEKDAIIDRTDPGKELLRIPILHAKYNRFLTLHNLALKRSLIEASRVKKLKWLYYTGKMDKSELDKLGWEPFQFTLKSDISVYIEGDPDIGNLNKKKAYHEEASSVCTYVMKELNNRTWQLKEFCTMERFIQGQH
jgi:hypothetical protein